MRLQIMPKKNPSLGRAHIIVLYSCVWSYYVHVHAYWVSQPFELKKTLEKERSR